MALGQGLLVPRQLLQRITAKEYLELREFHRLEPFGSEREDLRSAIGFQAICTAWGAKVELESFIPRRPDEDVWAEEQTAEEVFEMMGALVTYVNAGKSSDPT